VVFLAVVIAALLLGFVYLMSQLPKWLNSRRDPPS
jgi:hypothetical protein